MTKLLRRLHVSHKLALVCTSFLIPDFVLMCLFLVTINGYINFARQERNGIEYLRPLHQLLDELPRHQLLARQHLEMDPQSAEERSAVQSRVDAAFARLIAIDAELGESLQFTEEGLAQRRRERCRASFVADEWKRIRNQGSDVDEAANNENHQRLIADVRGMITHVGDTSNLILDPDLDSYYLMDITLLKLPQLQDRLATVVLHGESCLRQGDVGSTDRGQFKASAAMLQEADLDSALASARTALNEDQQSYGLNESLQRQLPPALKRFETAMTSFITLTSRLADDETPDVLPEEFVAAGINARRASSDLWNVAVDELDELLRTRIDHYRHRRAMSLLLAGLAFTAAILLVTWITRSISGPLVRQAEQLRQASEQTLASERRAREIVEAAPDCVITMDGAGNIVEFNRAAERMFGYGRESAVGRNAVELIAPARFREAHTEGLERYLRTGEGAVFGRRIERVGLRADGSEFPLEIAVSVVGGQDESTFIAFISDVSQRKETENELKHSLLETQLLLASISSVLIHLDSNGIVTRWNAAAELLFGLNAADVLGHTCDSLPWGDPSVPARLMELAGRFGSEELPHVVIVRRDGAERILDMTVTPICAEGQCSGVLVLGNDRSEHVLLESTLRQAQKLESIGQLTAGIAHEINTPMQFVSDNIEYLNDCSQHLFTLIETYEQNLSSAGPERSWQERNREFNDAAQSVDFARIRQQVPAAIRECKEGIDRVIHIVRAMKEFSHPGGATMKRIDLNESVRSAATVSRNRWKYAAELELELDPDLPNVDCLPAEINQLLLNLIVNAGDAISEKIGENSERLGCITVRTRADRDHVVIEVEDNGCGIPDAIRNRIFDPFFTTKDVGKGTGQGLAICYKIAVDMHHGTLAVASTPGAGTCFTVTVPIAQQIVTEHRTENESSPEAPLAMALID